MMLHEILEEVKAQTSIIELTRVSWVDKKSVRQTIWCRYGSFYQGNESHSDSYYLCLEDVLANDWQYAKKVWVPAWATARITATFANEIYFFHLMPTGAYA